MYYRNNNENLATSLLYLMRFDKLTNIVSCKISIYFCENLKIINVNENFICYFAVSVKKDRYFVNNFDTVAKTIETMVL